MVAPDHQTKCTIRFVVTDIQTKDTLSNVSIEENGKEISTVFIKGTYVTIDTRTPNNYYFDIVRPLYEVKRHILVAALTDTTTTTPSIALRKLSDLCQQLYREIQKTKPDTFMVNNSFHILVDSYNKTRDQAGLQNLVNVLSIGSDDKTHMAVLPKKLKTYLDQQRVEFKDF